MKSLPLDLELYQHASSLPLGKSDPEFVKKPELAIRLIDRSLERGERPGIVLIDSGYGNNASFLHELENRQLNYIGGMAKNRKVTIETSALVVEEMRLDKLAESLPDKAFTPIKLNLEKTKTVWVATLAVEISKLEGSKTVAIVMNAPTWSEASDIDYLITNVDQLKATPEWIVTTYSQRNWIEVFYREAKGWLGLKEYQVRDSTSLNRHFILVFCAYTFILWHRLTGGIRRRWANQPLNSFIEALEAFRTAISFRFIEWLNHNADVFAAYKQSLGFVWA